ncbi:MAG: hypothetical protein NTW13_03755 [Candidatus Omnitrophica bacterium]|nr:hypothetical protein [Candidatus Omnitrophota bacterium]
MIKDRAIAILAILTLMLFVFNIGSCSNAYRQKVARDKEMAQRLDLEEKMGKFNQEKSSLSDKLKAKEKELEEEKVVCEATKKALAQEQLVGQSLKDELQKVTKLKEALEENLKEALVANKKSKK